jgi:hypothetical protein
VKPKLRVRPKAADSASVRRRILPQSAHSSWPWLLISSLTCVPMSCARTRTTIRAQAYTHSERRGAIWRTTLLTTVAAVARTQIRTGHITHPLPFTILGALHSRPCDYSHAHSLLLSLLFSRALLSRALCPSRPRFLLCPLLHAWCPSLSQPVRAAWHKYRRACYVPAPPSLYVRVSRYRSRCMHACAEGAASAHARAHTHTNAHTHTHTHTCTHTCTHTHTPRC